MQNTTTVTFTHEEVDVLLHVLEVAYEHALENREERSRGDGRQIGADEPVTDNGLEEDRLASQPVAGVIKTIEEKIIRADLE